MPVPEICLLLGSSISAGLSAKMMNDKEVLILAISTICYDLNKKMHLLDKRIATQITYKLTLSNQL